MTGGRVYRGTRLPELDGAYIYGDWSTGHVWGIRHDGTKVIWHHELVEHPFNITGFGTDHAGELYIIDQASGGFYRLEPTTEADRPKQPFPTRLSETGLFASVATHMPHPAAIPFDVVLRSGPTGRRWSDSPRCRAWSGSCRSPSSTRAGPGRCPTARSWCRRSASTGSTLAGKPARKRVETRLLVRAAGRMDRLFVPVERRADRRRAGPGRRHRRGVRGPRPGRAGRPSRADLAVPLPHRVPDLPLARRRLHPGLHPAPARSRPQLRRHHRQPAPHARAHRRVRRHAAREAGGPAPAGQPLRRQGAAGGPGQVVPARQLLGLPRQRGRRQLPDGAGPRHPVGRMNLIDEVPTHDRFDIADARLVAPGSPERSVLYQRISQRGTGKMPPLVSTEVDREASKLIGDWIRGLPAGGGEETQKSSGADHSKSASVRPPIGRMDSRFRHETDQQVVHSLFHRTAKSRDVFRAPRRCVANIHIRNMPGNPPEEHSRTLTLNLGEGEGLIPQTSRCSTTRSILITPSICRPPYRQHAASRFHSGRERTAP